jgi:hypothetical protein
MLTHPETGEERIAANDAKNMEQRRVRKQSLYDRVFGI